jgi:AP-1-like factor
MEAYQEVSPLWNLSDPMTQLSDQDFFNLFQKQILVSANGINDFQTSPDGVDPQNLSMYSLSNLTPPSTSDESSPSPSTSNQDTSKDGVNDDPTLKRKANSDRLENEPNSKTQHMGEHLCVFIFAKGWLIFKRSASLGDKQDTSRRKSSGYPVSKFLFSVRMFYLFEQAKDEHRLLKRKEQNRAAQRAFRERKEKHVKDVRSLA